MCETHLKELVKGRDEKEARTVRRLTNVERPSSLVILLRPSHNSVKLTNVVRLEMR